MIARLKMSKNFTAICEEGKRGGVIMKISVVTDGDICTVKRNAARYQRILEMFCELGRKEINIMEEKKKMGLRHG